MKLPRVLLLLCFLPLSLHAQTVGRVGNITTDGTAYHVFARPGEATVQVLVLGGVSSPGLYEVGAGTDLGQLLALTGGPAATSQRQSNQEIRVTVRLFREEAGARTVRYEAPLEQMLASPATYPTLQDGDVFSVETVVIEHQGFAFRDVLTLLSTAATIALVIERITN